MATAPSRGFLQWRGQQLAAPPSCEQREGKDVRQLDREARSCGRDGSPGLSAGAEDAPEPNTENVIKRGADTSGAPVRGF